MSARSDAVFQKFSEVGIIPVVVLNGAKDAREARDIDVSL